MTDDPMHPAPLDEATLSLPELLFLGGLLADDGEPRGLSSMGVTARGGEDPLLVSGGRSLHRRGYMTVGPAGFDLVPLAAVIARAVSRPEQVLSLTLLDGARTQVHWLMAADGWTIVLRPVLPVAYAVTVIGEGLPSVAANVVGAFLREPSPRLASIAAVTSQDQSGAGQECLTVRYEPDGRLLAVRATAELTAPPEGDEVDASDLVALVESFVGAASVLEA